jgi:hypothetical protein
MAAKAAGKCCRYPFRERVLVRLTATSCVPARLSACTGRSGLAAGTLHVVRLKGSIDSTPALDRDELRDLRKLRQEVSGLCPPPSVDAFEYIVREVGRVAKMDVEVHPQMLRHSTGYSLAYDGSDTRLIQAFQGSRRHPSYRARHRDLAAGWQPCGR